jgi:hypothetical protein
MQPKKWETLSFVEAIRKRPNLWSGALGEPVMLVPAKAAIQFWANKLGSNHMGATCTVDLACGGWFKFEATGVHLDTIAPVGQKAEIVAAFVEPYGLGWANKSAQLYLVNAFSDQLCVVSDNSEMRITQRFRNGCEESSMRSEKSLGMTALSMRWHLLRDFSNDSLSVDSLGQTLEQWVAIELPKFAIEVKISNTIG